ncbi:MAG: hypothetical protein F7B17_02205 [Desulfurococcales archaeon]|nr:hypothetical protein [Desulfurococcales archaeon]
MACTAEEVERRLKLARAIVGSDLEDLQRMHHESERLEWWNRLYSLSQWFFEECYADLDREVARTYSGLIRLAQLMIAATFRREGSYPDIVSRFREEEYEVIEAFEAFKIFDNLSVDEIVEFIERREGKVYELVKMYYEKQFDVLERSWAPLIGALAHAIAMRYAERRRKIEDAVVAYMRRRGLSGFILEIEDAVKRLREAEELRAQGGGALREAEEAIARVEEALSRGDVREAERRASVMEEVEARIRELEERLEDLSMRITENVRGQLAEALRAEAEALRAELERLRRERERLEEARAAVELELERLRADAGAGGEGRLATSEDVAALIPMLEKVRLRLDEGFRLYDPLRRSELKPGSWRVERVESPLGDFMVRGYRLVRLEGIIFKKPRTVVEVLAVYPRELSLEKSVSKRPVGLQVVADLLEERVVREYYTVLILVSPTSFDKQALSMVEGGRLPPLASRRVTLYLVDSGAMRVYYNRGDEAAKRNRSLAEPLLMEEAVEKVLQWLSSDEARREALKASPVKPFLLAGDVAERLGVDRNAVKAAFERASEKGLGSVVESRGEVAFVYGVRSGGA